jgi:uncharacterized protein (DUF4415 family)
MNKRLTSSVLDMLTKLSVKFIMPGSNMKTITLDEMRVARERSESQSDWKRVRRMINDGIEPADDEESPNAAGLMQAKLEKIYSGHPPIRDHRVQISIQFHPKIIDYFKSKGSGWQLQMNKVLLEWIEQDSI